MIRVLEQNDYETWMDLAKEVEPLFGPMVNSKEFQEGITWCIKSKDAFGIENEKKELAGIIALNRDANEILWLAVGQNDRGKHYGDLLVKRAVEELESNGDILVQTFAENVEVGKNARTIYERNGFADLKNAGKNPANIDTVFMRRVQKR
jgi:GNAT superfamily N-acetyltransferase